MEDFEKSEERREAVKKIQKTIRDFRAEYQKFFDGGELSQTVTQDYWYSLYLSRKRLREKNIHLYMESFDVKSRNKEKKSGKSANNRVMVMGGIPQESLHFSFREDGKNESVIVTEKMKMMKTFLRGEDQKQYKFNELSVGEYVILNTQYAKNEYICPNCGAKQTLEQLLDGCDYCGTKYGIRDFDNKIAAFGYRRDETAIVQRLVIKSMIISFLLEIPSVFMALLVGMIRPDFFIGLIVSYMLLAAFTIFLASACAYVYVFLIFTDVGGKYFKRNSQERVLESVRRYNSVFSGEQFLASMGYKLKSIHFASTKDEINVYAQTDLSEFLKDYRDVIDCEVQKIKINQYTEDFEKSEQQLDIEATLCLTVDNGKKIFRQRERVRFQAVTDKDNRSKLYNETEIYACANCGTSVSVLDGGVCQSCGTRLDIHKHDWVISSYKRLSRRKLRRPLIPTIFIVLMSIAAIAALVIPILVI